MITLLCLSLALWIGLFLVAVESMEDEDERS